MNDINRVESLSRYNMYNYYNHRKHLTKMYYIESKRKQAYNEQFNQYFKDYWKLSLWNEDNMREYQKNKKFMMIIG